MRGVSGLAALAAATIGIAAFTVTPAAAVTFQVDTGASSVSVNPGAPVSAALALPSSFSILSAGDTATLDFITWTPTAFFAIGTPFSVTASLVISDPPLAGGSSTTTGNGHGSVLTLFGVLVAGSLAWDSGVPSSLTLDDGSKITINFEGGKALILNNSITTHAFVTLDVAGAEAPAPGETPLPAALPLFVSGLGALGLCGWRRKRKTQAAVA